MYGYLYHSKRILDLTPQTNNLASVVLAVITYVADWIGLIGLHLHDERSGENNVGPSRKCMIGIRHHCGRDAREEQTGR